MSASTSKCSFESLRLSTRDIYPVYSWSSSQLGPPPRAEVTGSRNQLLGSCRNAFEHLVEHLVWTVSNWDHVRHIQSNWQRRTGLDRFFPCELIIYTFQLGRPIVALPFVEAREKRSPSVKSIGGGAYWARRATAPPTFLGDVNFFFLLHCHYDWWKSSVMNKKCELNVPRMPQMAV